MIGYDLRTEAPTPILDEVPTAGDYERVIELGGMDRAKLDASNIANREEFLANPIAVASLLVAASSILPLGAKPVRAWLEVYDDRDAVASFPTGCDCEECPRILAEGAKLLDDDAVELLVVVIQEFVRQPVNLGELMRAAQRPPSADAAGLVTEDDAPRGMYL